MLRILLQKLTTLFFGLLCLIAPSFYVREVALGDRFGLFIQTLNNAEKLFIQLKKELSPT